MYKKVIFVLCSVLLFTMVSSSVKIPVSADVGSPLEINHEFEDKYKVEVVEETDTYEKVKYTTLSTGEVEYLETDLSGDIPEYIATYYDEETNQEMEVVITNDGDEVVIHNLTTNEVEKEAIQKELVLEAKNKDVVGTMNLPGGNGEYVKVHTFNGKKTVTDAMSSSISLIAGVVAGIFYGKKAGIATTIAMAIMTSGAPQFYYKHELYYWRDIPSYPAYYVRYYEYSNHTGYYGAAWNTTR